ncbi:MAG: AI-2E family transporter [Holosporaceae bacterium]|jgi:predicted PurR-regulated permease PerM|nr:AI-2E family transporter [Holosporaceae bacterium]
MCENTIGSRIKFSNGKFVFWIVVSSFSFLFFYAFSEICFPFVVGFALAYLCVPFMDSISSRINRTLVSVILSVGFVCIFIVIGVKLLPCIKEYLAFIADNIPFYYDRLIYFLDNTLSSVNFVKYKPEITSIKLELQKHLDQKVYIFASIIREIASKRETIANFVSFFIITPIAFFYFLRDWNGMTRFLYDCVPHRQKNIIREASSIVRKTFGNFFRGQFYVVMILSIYYALLLSAIGLNNCVYFGIISGLSSFIPFIGALFSCVIVILTCVPTLTMTKLYIILVVYSVGQFVEGYILSPRFVGKRTGLHPLWILFSFFAGIQLKGIVGVLIAIPMTAVIRNLVNFAMIKFKASQTYKQ